MKENNHLRYVFFVFQILQVTPFHEGTEKIISSRQEQMFFSSHFEFTESTAATTTIFRLRKSN